MAEHAITTKVRLDNYTKNLTYITCNTPVLLKKNNPRSIV